MFDSINVKDTSERTAGGYLFVGSGIIYYSFILENPTSEFIPSE